MTERSDAALIAAHRLGDTRATEQILARLEPTVRRLAGRWAPRLADREREDLEQEARLVVLDALASWEASKAPFAAWARLLIEQQFAKLAQQARAAKRGARLPHVSLFHRNGMDPGTGERLTLADTLADPAALDPAAIVVGKLALQEQLARLTPTERQVARLLMDGYTTEGAAEALDLTLAQVSKIRAAIRRRLEEE